MNHPNPYKKIFFCLTILFGLLSAFTAGEILCRIAGEGKPNLTLTGPKRLLVPDPDPQMAFRMRPLYQDFVYGAEVSINAEGLRDRSYTYEKSPVVKRILILGDSVAFGYGVPASAAFAKQWETWLQTVQPGRWEIINSGVPSYTTVQEVRWLEVEGLRYQPDAVVVTYVMNDPEPVHQLGPNGDFIPQEIDKFYQELAQQLPKLEIPWLHFSHLSRFLSRTFLHLHPRWKVFNEKLTRYFCEDIFHTAGWEACREAFLKLQKDCVEHKIFLLVAVYPTMFRLYSLDAHPFTPHYRRVQQFLAESQIPGILPFDDFLGQNVDVMRAYVDDPHPSKQSHRIFARRLHREFQKRWSDYGVPTSWD